MHNIEINKETLNNIQEEVIKANSLADIIFQNAETAILHCKECLIQFWDDTSILKDMEEENIVRQKTCEKLDKVDNLHQEEKKTEMIQPEKERKEEARDECLNVCAGNIQASAMEKAEIIHPSKPPEQVKNPQNNILEKPENLQKDDAKNNNEPQKQKSKKSFCMCGCS